MYWQEPREYAWDWMLKVVDQQIQIIIPDKQEFIELGHEGIFFRTQNLVPLQGLYWIVQSYY